MKYLITGGSGGLGREICKIIRRNGDISTTIGREDCDINVNFEFATYQNIRNALWAIDADVVIHCAGKNVIKAHADLVDLEDIHDLLQVNAVSQYLINQVLLENSIPKQIVHVVSDAAWTPMTHSLAYNMSKAAQLMMVRQMAHEEKRSIIYSVSPGKIANTGMSEYIDNTFPAMRGMTYEQGRAYQASRLRTGEMEPGTVANLILALVKNADKHYHGHNFSIGG